MLVSCGPAAASQRVQRVELISFPHACGTAKVVLTPSFAEEHVVQRFVAGGTGGSRLVLWLPQGYYNLYFKSAVCAAEVRVAVISGFDRHLVGPYYLHGLWDYTNAVAGRLPAGISKATLYSLDEDSFTVDATIDKGAYYADQHPLGGRYILVLESNHSPQKAQLAVDLSTMFSPPIKALERRDVSDDEYRAALGHTGSPFSHPTKIIQGPDDAMWFLNPAGNSLGRVDNAGAIRIFPLPTFHSIPIDIAASSTAVWVTEFNADKLARITPDGRVVEFTFPGPPRPTPDYGGQPRPARGPEYMALGSDGRIWFTEEWGQAVGAVDQSGSIIEYPIPQGYRSSGRLILGVDRHVWLLTDIPDIGGSVLFAISNDGSAQQFPLSGDCGTIALAKDGVWVGGTAFPEHTTQLLHVNMSGEMKSYNTPLLAAVPRHLVEDPTGALWFTDPEGNTIGDVSPDGVIEQYYKPEGVADLMAGPDGKLWYTLPKIGVIVRNVTGGMTAFPQRWYSVRGRSSDPTQLAVDRAGNVWFTEFNGNAVGVIRPNGKVDSYPLPAAR